jgi:phosphoketolase
LVAGVSISAQDKYAVKVPTRGAVEYENTKPLGEYLRDVMANNPHTFRLYGPDETASNRLQAVYQASKKTWMADYLPEDADGGELARDGRVMEMLSEHTLLGWLEGYLLTGRHGLFHTYEAFAHVVDSMFNQHAKWLDMSKNHVPWRAPGVGEHPAVIDRVASGSQRVLPSGPGVHRSGGQQGAVGRANLLAAGRQYAAGRRRSVPAQHRLYQRHRCR